MADSSSRQPSRKWVLALPWDLRRRLSWDSGLRTAVLEIFHRAVASRLPLLLRRRGLSGGEPGTVAVVRHFGSRPEST